jgi:hypothetical protein
VVVIDAVATEAMEPGPSTVRNTGATTVMATEGEDRAQDREGDVFHGGKMASGYDNGEA